jgi:DNA-binding transcriptional LysR family regulator
MVRNETRLMESAIALAEALHFSRAARKIGISQPMLTKNIQDLEALLGGPLFIRDRKHVHLSDAGRAYVEQARLSLLYGERAVQAARSVMREVDVPLYVGKSPYIDPFLITTLLSLRLPLFPKLTIELVSQYSVELAHDLMAGAIDLALATEPPESPSLTRVKVTQAPFYIAMSKQHDLAMSRQVSLSMLHGHKWILFERRLHPPVYDKVLSCAEAERSTPKSISHVTAPEEAFPFVADGSAVAFVVKAGALLLARNGVTVRPLTDDSLLLNTYLVSRADNETKLASELVRAFMRKVTEVKTESQLKLPIH